MNEEFSRKRLLQGIIFTLLITFATGMGNVLSAFFMLNVKKQEVEDTQLAEARRRATELHCLKLQESASLAAEIVFRADQGYPNNVSLYELMYETSTPTKRVPDDQIKEEQKNFEHQVFGLLPYLQPDEAQVMKQVTLQHFIVTAMRTSKVPAEHRTSPAEDGFDFNKEMQKLRDGGDFMGQIFRERCMRIR
ncbi:hypothetical protein [Enterobacter quasiroggenkampii]|uniref:hypothetical protein n=1 Tax=Enterobacter quasiroggenkampii TaxID=2497436 RepID=UPI00200622C2|nr:hypothetical protein [Enterobacter quasiroggenkampii]MCK7310443.1 hypothetical protein [Enterobacter quasiroggenkampii]